VEDEEERKRLKEMASKLKLDEGLGLIVRTASIEQSKTALERDLSFLKRLWKDVRQKGTTQDVPSIIYKEAELASRAVRDYLTDDISEVWLDDKATADQVTEMVALVFPRRRGIVKLHTDVDHGLWERFNLKRQIEQLHSREVTMQSGGRLVFDHTEALTAVDINSGKIGGETNFKEMVLKTNMEAAAEIARQLRMRDIGGQVVIDFIEMKDRKHCAEVEKTLRAAVKNDRARTDVGRLSKFGLLEMVRQRIGSSALSISDEPCSHCAGSGRRRNLEWQSMQSLKDIYRQLKRQNCPEVITYKAPDDLALYLLNQKRARLCALETEYGKTIVIAQE